MTLGPPILNYGFIVKVMLIILPNFVENEVFRWLKNDAQLCIVIKSIIHLSIKQIFHAYQTCSEVWEQKKLLYTNDTQRLYGVCRNILTVVAHRHLDCIMAKYLGKLHALLHDFNEL